MKELNRRELLGCAAVLLSTGCATMPARSARLPEGAPDRACDHELCRYWRPAQLQSGPGAGGKVGLAEERIEAAAPLRRAEGEFTAGRCSIGLPEGL